MNDDNATKYYGKYRGTVINPHFALTILTLPNFP